MRTRETATIRAAGLVKRYGGKEALAGLDLEVEPGTVHGLLGHNGAGKTTAVAILATLIAADGGRATIGGRDVASEAAAVRELITVAGQQASLDELLTGRENLVLLGRLLALSKGTAAARASELLERFGLTEAADRVVGGYSGGMRRRLDLAACLVVPRPVIFLDEPTTGLDPASRLAMWGMIRDLVVGDGSALLLTTQYLDEADRLADRITVLSAGRAVAAGTPGELKDAIGGRRVELSFDAEPDREAARLALAGRGFAVGAGDLVEPTGADLTVPAERGAADLEAVLETLGAAAVPVDEAKLARPSLDDVFFALAEEGR